MLRMSLAALGTLICSAASVAMDEAWPCEIGHTPQILWAM